MQDLNCVFEGIDGKGAIFISTIHAAKNVNLLKKHNIQAVLSIARGAYIPFNKQEVPNYLYLPADDHEDYDLSQHFPHTYSFIESSRRHTNILIHCMAGISRSATVTAAYLIKKFDYSVEKVIKHLKRKRAKIDPNPGFMKQLTALEQQLSKQKEEKENIKQQNKVNNEDDPEDENYFGECHGRNSTHSTSHTNHISPSKEQQRFIQETEKNALQLSFCSPTKEEKSPEKSPPPNHKRSKSICLKIDRIKRSFQVQLKPASDLSPLQLKTYSPLLYKPRTKIPFLIN